TMMNNARLSVGLEGVGLAERALQAAKLYASERVQGTRLGEKNGEKCAIENHADVRRMLTTMAALTAAGRALAYDVALNIDRARAGDARAQRRVDILTPVVKSWCTDNAVEVASLGVQVHGGMGYIEETGAAQFYRDARILPIYEGTNGIQALDLLFRKLLRDKGESVSYFIAEMVGSAAEVSAADWALADQGHLVLAALDDLQKTTRHLLHAAGTGAPGALDSIAEVAVPYQSGFGFVAGAVMMLRRAGAAAAHRDLADFYMRHLLPRAKGLFETVRTAG
ncbi:MAG: acyl-CoA dehydrogenase, partial [Alphaproteobacteria bacterium]|nr:acyl-CoA dehydrogenase [Alphaproteobacteria bacterium]